MLIIEDKDNSTAREAARLHSLVIKDNYQQMGKGYTSIDIISDFKDIWDQAKDLFNKAVEEKLERINFMAVQTDDDVKVYRNGINGIMNQSPNYFNKRNKSLALSLKKPQGSPSLFDSSGGFKKNPFQSKVASPNQTKTMKKMLHLPKIGIETPEVLQQEQMSTPPFTNIKFKIQDSASSKQYLNQTFQQN